jgi:hypothetical protein
VCTFAFDGGKVYFQNKFVRTKGFVEEQRAGKALYRCAGQGVCAAKAAGLLLVSQSLPSLAAAGLAGPDLRGARACAQVGLQQGRQRGRVVFQPL